MEERIMDYDVFPSIVKSGEVTQITIRPRGRHAAFIEDTVYLLTFVPMECSNVPHEIKWDNDFDTAAVTVKNGEITFSYAFEGEQQWNVVFKDQNDTEFEKTFHIYSVYPDLYGKRAFKGDLHIHSFRSDGMEDPAVVAANYRKAGFDFIAITDHRKWEPSIEAIESYKDVDIDLKLFPGEEVHIPGDYIHVVNFGGTVSVNERYQTNKEKIDAEVREAAEKLSLPQGINPLEYSYRKWIADSIHQGAGIAILVHPFWYFRNQYNMQTKMTEYLLQEGVFDAFELFGGQTVMENNMQSALYNELRSKGVKIPIVGSSDSHGTEPPIWFKTVQTVLLSEGLELEQLKSNIQELYSAAVECLPGNNYIVEGSYRMVKYVLFLLKYYFPRHDELCFEEGVLMKNYICGDQYAKNQLSYLSGRTNKFAQDYFGF